MDTALRSPLPDPTPFLHRLLAALQTDGLEIRDMELDHICYRVSTEERYAKCRILFAQHGTLLVESLIAGRPIATYSMHRPFTYLDRRIAVVELASPKAGRAYPEGYEHVEFVVPGCRSATQLLAFAQRYPALPWDLGGMHKTSNPDVRLRYPGFSVKFHGQSLVDVIAEELRDQR